MFMNPTKLSSVPPHPQTSLTTAPPSAPVTAPPVAVAVEGDPVPVELRDVLALFAGPLAQVAFPDVDAALLGRHADAVRAAAREVARAEAMVADARRQLDERTATLTAAARRGLAYARIYAEAHPELDLVGQTTIAAAPLQPPEPPRPRRGRPPKTPRPELPFTAAPGPAGDA
jgi:hypothetical protein